jgi:hypothetical protein
MTSIAERIAYSLPGSSFELEQLVRLVGIEETDRIPTAAVTTRGRARLLINPAFVAEHCRSDEHLFLLVMHEMWHVLLGHTTLYRRTTVLHDIAFDAVINAGTRTPAPGARLPRILRGDQPGGRVPGAPAAATRRLARPARLPPGGGPRLGATHPGPALPAPEEPRVRADLRGAREAPRDLRRGARAHHRGARRRRHPAR